MRARPDEFIVETKIGNAVRNQVWHADHALDLDLPRGWTLDKIDERLRFRDRSGDGQWFYLDPMEGGETRTVRLPSAKLGRYRPLTVTLRKLRPPRPVYVANPTLSALHTTKPRQLCAFYGQRYFLIHYRPVGQTHVAALGPQAIFDYKKTAKGYTLRARKFPIKASVGGRKYTLDVNTALELSEVDFFRCTVVQGIHWWRFRMVPTPNGQPPLESDESDEDLREASRLQYSAIAFFAMFGVILAGLHFAARYFPPAPKVVHAEVALKAPKVFPKFEEKKPLPPPPPPEVAKVEPPPPPPPKPEPAAKKEVPPEVVKLAKPVKHVAKVKKPAKAKVAVAKAPTPEPPSPPAKVVKDEGPTPEQLAATQKATEQAAEKAQMLKSLNFLSTSASRPNIDASAYEQKEGKFAEAGRIGGLTAKSNVLDTMVKGAPGDGDIQTKSGRNIASKLSFGKNKGLNDVQGKVSLGELSAKNGDPGSALGDGKGLELSGPGQLSQSEIEKALAKYLSKFQYCYEKALLTNAGLSGNLVLQWTVTGAGKASDARVTKSQLNNNDLHSCLKRVLGEVTFPKPKGGGVTVKKTFSFTSSSI